MPALHTINKSPFERNAVEGCISRAAKGSNILLMEDAIYAAMSGTKFADMMAKAAKDFSVHVLGPDLTARGMSHDQVLDGIKVVDYGGFVDLAAESSVVQSWL